MYENFILNKTGEPIASYQFWLWTQSSDFRHIQVYLWRLIDLLECIKHFDIYNGLRK